MLMPRSPSAAVSHLVSSGRRTWQEIRRVALLVRSLVVFAWHEQRRS